MISKSTIKLIKSLALKKYRLKENLFLVEGDKNVIEVLNSGFKINQLYATENFILQQKINLPQNIIAEVNKEDIKKASLLKSPQNALAICHIHSNSNLPEQLNNSLTLYLDCIQDPGNLGTIIRISDWFGIEKIYCSPDTVDFYNPKTIQATMGSFCRVQISYTPFKEFKYLADKSNASIYGAFLEGENVYTTELKNNSVLIIGNEGNGINKEIETQVEKKISIPHFHPGSRKVESLNAAIATSIICSEFKRRTLSFYSK